MTWHPFAVWPVAAQVVAVAPSASEVRIWELSGYRDVLSPSLSGAAAAPLPSHAVH
jgi:hypothetical protein